MDAQDWPSAAQSSCPPTGASPPAVPSRGPRIVLSLDASQRTKPPLILFLSCLLDKEVKLARCRIAFYLSIPRVPVALEKPFAEPTVFISRERRDCLLDFLNMSHDDSPFRFRRKAPSHSPVGAAIGCGQCRYPEGTAPRSPCLLPSLALLPQPTDSYATASIPR